MLSLGANYWRQESFAIEVGFAAGDETSVVGMAVELKD